MNIKQLVRTIFLVELSLRTKRLYIKWLVYSLCLVKQSHNLKHFQNNVFGTVLLSLGLLCRAGNHLSNFVQCSTPRNDRSWGWKCSYVVWDLQTTFEILRRIDLSLFQHLSDCPAGLWVIYLFYNTITPTLYWLVQRVELDFRSLVPFGNLSKS